MGGTRSNAGVGAGGGGIRAAPPGTEIVPASSTGVAPAEGGFESLVRGNLENADVGPVIQLRGGQRQNFSGTRGNFQVQGTVGVEESPVRGGGVLPPYYQLRFTDNQGSRLTVSGRVEPNRRAPSIQDVLGRVPNQASTVSQLERYLAPLRDQGLEIN